MPLGDVISQLDLFSKQLFLGFDHLRAYIFAKYLNKINARIENWRAKIIVT